jgi:hypothetical protein
MLLKVYVESSEGMEFDEIGEMLAADVVNNDLKNLTDDSRTSVFIVDDSLFSRSSCKKTELGSRA